MTYNKYTMVFFAFAIPVLFGCLSVWLGQDANWDLKNYHYYNPYAVLNSRLELDHNAAGIQSYFNPSVDIMTTYPLFKYAGPIGFSFVMGGFHGLNFVVLALIALELLRDQVIVTARSRWLLSLLAAALGMSGALAASEIGTTFGDLTLSVLNLAALWLVMRAARLPWGVPLATLVACGGFVAGISAGFKLVNAIYCLALLLAMLPIWRQRRYASVALAGGSALLGFLLAHGWWSIYLWQLYGSPVFPFFNEVFQSAYFPATNLFDTRFFPKGWLQTLFYPFYFSWNHQTAEIEFRDFRYPLAYLCLLLWGGGVLYARLKSQKTGVGVSSGDLLVALFVLISYVVWQVEFSIQRYAITIELLLPMVILLALIKVFDRHAIKLFVSCAIFLTITTQVCYWGRVGYDKGAFYTIHDHRLAELRETMKNSTIILGSPPLAYLVPAFNLSNAAWIWGSFNRADWEKARSKMQGRTSVFMITRTTDQDLAAANSLLEQYGQPKAAGQRCRPFSTNADESLLLCAVSGQVDAGAGSSLFASGRSWQD